MESTQKERIPVANLFSLQGKTAIVTGGILGALLQRRQATLWPYLLTF